MKRFIKNFLNRLYLGLTPATSPDTLVITPTVKTDQLAYAMRQYKEIGLLGDYTTLTAFRYYCKQRTMAQPSAMDLRARGARSVLVKPLTPHNLSSDKPIRMWVW
jgi:hypothetical protein